MTLSEAKKKLERVARDEHKQYTAAFKLALLKLLDHASELGLVLADIRRDAIGLPDSTFVARVRARIDDVLADVEARACSICGRSDTDVDTSGGLRCAMCRRRHRLGKEYS
jgi:hypothetical protein